MSNEIELMNDGDGVAIFGESLAVERFLGAYGLPSKEIELHRLGRAFSAGSAIAQTGSEAAANSGRWVKLTKESAAAMKQAKLMKGSSPGVSRAVLTEKGGKIKGILEIVKTPGSILTNPAMLAGAAGIMAQLAMQQTMEEITDYLAKIDAKVDDVLRAQKDSVLAEMIGVEFVLEEAMTVRDHVGRVSDITWSKVQGTSQTVGQTQAYALRQLDALAEKLEQKTKASDLAEASREVEGKVQEWLAVLAHCFRLQEGIAVLELERVFDSSPDELERHRVGLRVARQKRIENITRATARLLERIDAAAAVANEKVLLHPLASKSVVRSSNQAGGHVIEFQDRLGIASPERSLESRRWVDAAVDVRDKVLEAGSDGVEAAQRVGVETFGRAKEATGKFAGEVTQRLPRWPRGVRNDEDES